MHSSRPSCGSSGRLLTLSAKLNGAETVETAVARATDLVETVFDQPVVRVCAHDPATESVTTLSSSSGGDNVPDRIPEPLAERLGGRGNGVSAGDAPDATVDTDPPDPLQAEALVPVGRDRVLRVGVTGSDGLSTVDSTVIQGIAANLEATLSRLVRAVDASLTVTDVSRQDDGTCAVFVAVEVTPGHDGDRIEATPGASVLRTDTAGMTCVLTLGPESPTRQLVRQGAALQQVEIRPDSNDIAVTVRLPYETEVREYVDTVTDVLDNAELVAKRHRSVDWQSDSTVATAVDDRLTDRQREALQIGFHAGYFDWPRNADADTVAAEMGIAQSTFSQHLRAAERKLLEELFS
jgi:hypothetical protein